MPITHAKISVKSDGSDDSLIRPSDWNADHVGGLTTTRYRITEQDADLDTWHTITLLPAGALVTVAVVFVESFDAGGYFLIGIDDGLGGSWTLYEITSLSTNSPPPHPDGTFTASLTEPPDVVAGNSITAVVGATPQNLLIGVGSPNPTGPGIVDVYVTLAVP